VGRWHPDIGHDHVRRISRDRRQQGVSLADGGDDLVSFVHEQAGQAFAQQDGVLGQDHAHGNSAVTTVPAPTGLDTVSTPSKG
jgi:hypothetical protein